MTKIYLYPVLPCTPFIYFDLLGTGESSNPNWYYKSEDSKCTAFIFTGSEGNANRFETQEQCERQCGEFKNQVITSIIETLF